MQIDLKDRVAALTGGDHPVGAVLSRRLAENGAAVELLADRRGEAVGEVAARRGRIDILVNILLDGDMTVGEIDGLCRASAQAMRAGGRIVNVTSALGLVPARGAGGLAAVAAGILSLTRTLALELGPSGILVNGLGVGADEANDVLSQRLLSHVPMARAGRFDEIASAVLFLVDPDNSYMTGHVMTVDGGWTVGFARNF